MWRVEDEGNGDEEGILIDLKPNYLDWRVEVHYSWTISSRWNALIRGGCCCVWVSFNLGHFPAKLSVDQSINEPRDDSIPNRSTLALSLYTYTFNLINFSVQNQRGGRCVHIIIMEIFTKLNRRV